MRNTIDELEVMGSRVLLPAEDERVELATTNRPDQPLIRLRAFTEDPRQADGVPPRVGRRIDRFSALAYRAVAELTAPLEMPADDRVGVFFANTHAGWAYAEPQMESLSARGPRAVAPYFVTAWFPTAATGEVTIGLGYRGASKTTTGRRSAFAEALWLARDALERGSVDVALVGAVESVVAPFAMLNWPPVPNLPTEGAGEGAVVFAVRQLPAADPGSGDPGSGGAGSGGAVLSGLRYDGTDRTTTADQHWIPTLSIAAELARHTSPATDAAEASDDGGVDVALGDGYRVTVAARRSLAAA